MTGFEKEVVNNFPGRIGIAATANTNYIQLAQVSKAAVGLLLGLE